MPNPMFEAPGADFAPIVTQPPEVAALIEDFTLLNEEEYRNELADAVFAGDHAELAALHSDELIGRTLTAAKHLVVQANNRLNHRTKSLTPQQRENTQRFRDSLAIERARAQALFDNLRARQGRPSNAPNASSRAYRRLAKAHPEEFVRYKREARAEIADEEARAKADRRRARAARDAKRQGGPRAR